MTVYIDSLFLTNFFMDSILIFITGIMRRKQMKTKNIIVASFLSALYGVLIFFPDLSFLYGACLRICFSFIPVIIAFRPSGIRDLTLSWIFFMFMTFTAGGIIFCISSVSSFGKVMNAMVSNCIMYVNMSPLILLIGSVTLYVFVEIYNRTCRKNFLLDDFIIDIKIGYMGKEFGVKGLIDTGCELREPLSGAPCIIVEKEVFGEAILSGSKIKINTASGDAVLDMILPDGFECSVKGIEVLWDCVVVLCENKLSDYGMYNALINPDAIGYSKNKINKRCKNEV